MNKDRKKQIFSERGVFRCSKGVAVKKSLSFVPATPLSAGPWCQWYKQDGGKYHPIKLRKKRIRDQHNFYIRERRDYLPSVTFAITQI